MAEIAVNLLIQKMTDAFIQEVDFLSEVPAKIEWIRAELLRMRYFLVYADAKGTSGDGRAKNWVKAVTVVAYEAEDIVDEIRFKIEKRRQETSSRWMILGSAARSLSKPKSSITSHKIGAIIDVIKKKIEDIASSRFRYGITYLGEVAHHDAVKESNALVESYRRGEETDVVGFEKDKQKLLDLLLDANCTRRSAVTVVGMGGLGKTTLARKVYRSPDIPKHFGATAFVSVSETLKSAFLVKDITKQVMANAITKVELDRMSEEEAKVMLHNFLSKGRYLIVLDDIWETNDWYQLKDAFPDVSNGSRLLIITRSLTIAEHAEQIIPPHKLEKLSDGESWELFQKKAFPVGQCCPEHLEVLGRLLSRRCDGLPLALVVLGGLFCRMPRTYVAWSEVANRINWESRIEASVCRDILHLSYSHLPHQNLRLCFLYIGHFPEDHVINASRLIRLWVAEGLIPKMRNETLEETARDYLNELVRRSMVQVVERSMASGKIKSVGIHDLLRDLCIREARKAGFMVSCTGEIDLSIISEDIMGVYRIATSRISTIEQMISLQKQKLHTLVCFEQLRGLKSFGSLKLLRVMDVEVLGTNPFEFPYEIGRLIHLRYLRCKFYKGARVELPSNMGNLYNLQTLILADADVKWSTALWTIPALRHVCSGDSYMIDGSIPGRIPALKQLQTLYRVSAGEWIKMDLPNAVNLRKLAVKDIGARDVELLANALEKLDNLVSLELEADCRWNSFILEALQSRKHLRSLKLCWNNIEEFPAASNVFAPSLTKLILKCLCLKHDPMPVLERLPNLMHLELLRDSSRSSRAVSSAGGFPQLQFLRIHELKYLEDWIVETGAMPKLTHLHITGCSELRMIPSGLQEVTSLQILGLDMHEDFIRRVTEGGEDWEKVKHIPSIITNIISPLPYPTSPSSSAGNHKIDKRKQSAKIKDIMWNGITTFTYSELKQATSNFSKSNELGKGGFGKVYKGDLLCTKVAIKILHREGDASQEQAFRREVDTLCRARHPHLVQLIGVCPKKFAVVYEFMEGGTLEDRLARKDIPWQDRIRIVAEICSALVFLHSRKPDIMVHGDLKPANILLDASGMSKLGDFGICRIIPPSNTTTTAHITATSLQGSDGYMDPLLKQNGKIQPSIDVYAFGMIALRLLTNGQPGHELVIHVEEALSEKCLEVMLDPTAGWPSQLAEELSDLAVKCCDVHVKRRPQLQEVWEKLKEMRNKASPA